MSQSRAVVCQPQSSFDDHDEINFPRPQRCRFDDIVDQRVSRRSLLNGGLAMSTAAFISASGLLPSIPLEAADRFGFSGIAANSDDTVSLPPGYQWQVVVRWGDPMWSSTPEFDPSSRGTAASQARAFGDNNDGMALFEQNGSTILAVNNEYTNLGIMFGNRDNGLPADDDDVLKGINAHGISIIEIENKDGRWIMLQDSPFNRRITPLTPMEITGPARGAEFMKTTADRGGIRALGTWNNCGCGRTPWGTYLTCEENFNGYFSYNDPEFMPDEALKRYGIGARDRGYGWARVDPRFDVAHEPNEPNRCGYVVEIDPLDPHSLPKKHTALGRFKHENAELVIAADGRVVVYMGDDERSEFLYKYVSDNAYVPDSDTSPLLQHGQLYAARFHEDGTGEWIALTAKTTGMLSDAEICVFTRIAASRAGATTMDRPEWVAANPHRPELYCALTNNKARGRKPNKGGDASPVGGPNPREANKYGQIVRWRPRNDDHADNRFSWDLFVLAGNPAVYPNDTRKGSENITAGNMFNSPDGLFFDSRGRLWIQTDGKYTNSGDFAGMGNNQMLVGDPESGEIRRFMVGPRQCEITGSAWSSDYRSLFVGIQHPGETGSGGHFPDGGTALPRSCIIAVTREDGGRIG